MTREKRILYVQYTNPGAYPPLEHSSRILADAGWQVRFLGTGAYGAAHHLKIPPHPNILIRLQSFQPGGWRQKVNYVAFVAWCLTSCLKWRPSVVYCSDLWGTPIGVLLWYLLRIPVVYHEHDEPGAARNAISRFVHSMRRRLARVAEACVIPQQERLQQFKSELRPRRGICVWNCPRRDEVLRPNDDRRTDGFRLFYVGSLNSSLLPEAIVRVLAELSEEVQLHVVGYETVGSVGYVQRLMQLATELGVANRVNLHGPTSRREFFQMASNCDVGLCLISTRFGDVNRQFLFGASNKLFDYLACGLAVIVPKDQEWVSQIVDHGYGVSCELDRAETMSSVFEELCSKPAEFRRMGELGRQRILKDWNYETQFDPVRRLLEQIAETGKHIASR